jgi:hypothetical protein
MTGALLLGIAGALCWAAGARIRGRRRRWREAERLSRCLFAAAVGCYAPDGAPPVAGKARSSGPRGWR